MERKNIQIELKADSPGGLQAIFSRFNVIDLDNDVTLPGAFEDGAATRLLPAHDWAHYMIGKGVIHSDNEVALFDGMFNLATDGGRNWYESLKFDAENGRPLQEFSYGFDVLESSFGQFEGQEVRFLSKLKVHEVSPVTLGAGIQTGTVSIKNRDTKADILTTDDSYESLRADIESAVGMVIPLSEHGFVYTAATFSDHVIVCVYGWIGADGDECVYFDIPYTIDMAPGDTQGQPILGTPTRVEEAFVPVAGKGVTSATYFADQAEHVLADVQGLRGRAAGILTLRAKEGRTLSAANTARLGTVADAVGACADELRVLLTDTAPSPKERSDLAEVIGLYVEFQNLTQRYAVPAG